MSLSGVHWRTFYSTMLWILLRPSLRLPLGLRILTIKSRQKNPVFSGQRDEIQNALFEPSEIFWKLSSNFYEIIFYPSTFPRCLYEFSARRHCLKYSREHTLPFISWAKVCNCGWFLKDILCNLSTVFKWNLLMRNLLPLFEKIKI